MSSCELGANQNEAMKRANIDHNNNNNKNYKNLINERRKLLKIGVFHLFFFSIEIVVSDSETIECQ